MNPSFEDNSLDTTILSKKDLSEITSKYVIQDHTKKLVIDYLFDGKWFAFDTKMAQCVQSPHRCLTTDGAGKISKFLANLLGYFALLITGNLIFW